MKKFILKSSIALAVAGVFGATVAVTAAEQATPVPVTQEVAATAAPVAEPATHQVVPTIQVTPAAKDTTPVPTATQEVKADKKADKKETTKEEKKTLKVENHNLAQQVSKQA